jgi:energy-coupling factor transport system ATP-binding protein
VAIVTASAAATSPALRFDAVRFRYPGAARDAVDGVSLALGAGDGVALVGPNGAGKTTLLRLAMALAAPASGRVESAGRDTAGLGPEDLADRVGFLFQQPETQLFERTVARELAFGPAQLGWPADRTTAAVAATLDELGLAADAERHPYDLPAPRRRIVALGAALVADPALLLLDEPTAGLDRATRRLVESVVRARRARGVAVLAVTHDAGFALEALGRGVALAGGRIAADGPIAEVLAEGGAPLPLPAPAEVARRLALDARTLRLDDVARAVAERCSTRNRFLS